MEDQADSGIGTETTTPSAASQKTFYSRMARGALCAGWCATCLKPDEPPEITFCVVDGAGTLNLQAMTPAMPMPEEEELNLKFAELVVSWHC